MVSGGGIFSTLGTVKMRGGTTITGNRAGDNGGGICVQSPTGLEQFEVLIQLIVSLLTPKCISHTVLIKGCDEVNSPPQDRQLTVVTKNQKLAISWES